MSLENEITLSEEFLSEFKSEKDDEFGSIVKRIQGMSYEADFVVEQDEEMQDRYLNVFDRLVGFAGEEHQATDKIIPSINRVQECFENYTPPWERELGNKELTL